MTDTLVGRLIRIADASRREDGTDIPLGEQCREAAAEIERLTREVAGYQETIRLSNAWDFPRDIQELSVRLEAAESSLSEAVKAEREACAKVADAKAIEFLSPEYATGQPFSSFNERFACGQVASAIRSRAAVLDSERGSTHEA